MEATRHADYSMASSTLNTALLASVGEENRNHLKTPEAIHALSARNSRHHACQARCQQAPRPPVSSSDAIVGPDWPHGFLIPVGQPASDTERPRGNRLVSGFPSVPASMAGYTQYPAILQQSLATLFPFLENLKDHLTRSRFTVFRSSKSSPTFRYSQPPASVPPQQQQQPHQAAAAAG
jgi:hypothetical protein